MEAEMERIQEILENSESAGKKIILVLMEASVKEELYQQKRDWHSAVRRGLPGVLTGICCRNGIPGEDSGNRVRSHQHKTEQSEQGVFAYAELERVAAEMAEEVESAYSRSDDFRKAAIRSKALNIWDSAEMLLKRTFTGEISTYETDRSLMRKINENCSMLIEVLDFCNSAESSGIDSLLMMDERLEAVRESFVSIRKLLQNAVVDKRSFVLSELRAVDGSTADETGGVGARRCLNSADAAHSGLNRLNYTLRITLLDVMPVPWRIVTIPECLFLGELHRVIQMCFGQERGNGKYCFHIHGKKLLSYSSASDTDSDTDFLDGCKSETQIMPFEFAGSTGDVFEYCCLEEKNRRVKIEIIGSCWYNPCRQHRFNYPRCIKGRAGVPGGTKSMKTVPKRVGEKRSRIIPYNRRGVNKELKRVFAESITLRLCSSQEGT